MCYRTQLNTRISEIERAFEATFTKPESYHPQDEINGFDFPHTPVIADYAPGEILPFQWGLVPFWAKNDQIKKHTLNAKIETVREKPSFRNVVKNRCLILATAYYEWQWLDEKGRRKQKYLIRSAEEPIFAFAGLYSTWQDRTTDASLTSYTLLTTEANTLMSEIHNHKKRMPVLLRKEDYQNWLQGQEIEQFAFPYEAPLTAERL